MFVAACILGGSTVLLELSLVKRIKPIHDLIKKQALLGLVFSVILAFGLGFIFGAHGVTVMLAALIGIVITQPYYMWLGRKVK